MSAELEKFTSIWPAPYIQDHQALMGLKDKLKKRGVENVFVGEWNLIWQFNYLGDEKLNGRPLHRSGRIENYLPSLRILVFSPLVAPKSLLAHTGHSWICIK